MIDEEVEYNWFYCGADFKLVYKGWDKGWGLTAVLSGGDVLSREKCIRLERSALDELISLCEIAKEEKGRELDKIYDAERKEASKYMNTRMMSPLDIRKAMQQQVATLPHSGTSRCSRTGEYPVEV